MFHIFSFKVYVISTQILNIIYKQSSLAFFVFVLRGFANYLVCPKNKNISSLPFNGQKHQNCAKPPTDLWAVLHYTQGAKEKKISLSRCYCKERKTLKIVILLIIIVNNIQIFTFRGWSWNINPRENRGMTV
jgi:hypothetical protein